MKSMWEADSLIRREVITVRNLIREILLAGVY